MQRFRSFRGLWFPACLIIFFVQGLAGSWAQADAPVLYFSDIAGGPKTGNSDTSLGQSAGQNGAIVTIWGRHLDSARVYCNGAEAAHYYFRGNATAPADLYTFHRMQMISFQVSALAQDGAGAVYATTSGGRSNDLPFTVRAGNIYFVQTTGDDATGSGTWSLPWRTILKAVATIAPGDIAYIGDGVDATSEADNRAAVNLDSDGTSTQPKALVVYPGAVSRVGNPTIERAFFLQSNYHGGFSMYWVIAKFRLTTAQIGAPAYTGFRVVGNYITAPYGDGLDGAINGSGDHVRVLGNELDRAGATTCTKFYHAIYFTGYRTDDPPRAPMESDREIAWNYVHDCLTNRAINIYSEQANSAYIERHSVHDNVILNQKGDGILLGDFVIGENWVYNNLLIRAGGGPEWDEPSYHTGIHLGTGHDNIPASTTIIHIYNNTLYGCGWSGAVYTEENGSLVILPWAVARSTLRLWNNIIYSTGDPYIATESVALPGADYRNCWFGAGVGPAWDTGAINLDPQFRAAAGNDLQLALGSPCIDAGRDVSAIVARDLLGAPRPQGAAFDVGAYEFTVAPTAAARWSLYGHRRQRGERE